MEVEASKNASARTTKPPSPPHLSERRMDAAAHSPMAFGTPCAACGHRKSRMDAAAHSPMAFASPYAACGRRKRRFLDPSFSPRKKMHLELPDMSFPPLPPPPSATVPPASSSPFVFSTYPGSATLSRARSLPTPRHVGPAAGSLARTGSLPLVAHMAARSSPAKTVSACCVFFTSPPTREASASPGSTEDTNKPVPESLEGSIVTEERPISPPARSQPAGPPQPSRGSELVVRVTCTCGVEKEFCFDQCH